MPDLRGFLNNYANGRTDLDALRQRLSRQKIFSEAIESKDFGLDTHSPSRVTAIAEQLNPSATACQPEPNWEAVVPALRITMPPIAEPWRLFYAGEAIQVPSILSSLSHSRTLI